MLQLHAAGDMLAGSIVSLPLCLPPVSLSHLCHWDPHPLPQVVDQAHHAPACTALNQDGLGAGEHRKQQLKCSECYRCSCYGRSFLHAWAACSSSTQLLTMTRWHAELQTCGWLDHPPTPRYSRTQGLSHPQMRGLLGESGLSSSAPAQPWRKDRGSWLVRAPQPLPLLSQHHTLPTSPALIIRQYTAVWTQYEQQAWHVPSLTLHPPTWPTC
jgi:hypothetical protein